MDLFVCPTKSPSANVPAGVNCILQEALQTLENSHDCHDYIHQIQLQQLLYVCCGKASLENQCKILHQLHTLKQSDAEALVEFLRESVPLTKCA